MSECFSVLLRSTQTSERPAEKGLKWSLLVTLVQSTCVLSQVEFDAVSRIQSSLLQEQKACSWDKTQR